MPRPLDRPTVLHPDPAGPDLWTGAFPSGLRLIVREDHRLPVAAVNVWVRVGSNREPEALRGWSHGIEHMLFKGTARRGEADFALEVAAAGGVTNAGTGYETTNYHVTLPAARLAVAVDILGDALFHSAFDPAALDAEREVLVHENHMYDDRPFGFGLTWRLGLERALDVSPYRHPIGGRDANLRERSRDEIVAFWRSAYRPDNATVVVVGDVVPADVAALVAAHFPVAARTEPEAAPAGTALVASPPVEPRHDAARLRIASGDVVKAYAKLIFSAPGDRDPRRDALSVLQRVLGDGRSCRLHRQVREEAELLDDFFVAVETGPREGLVVIDLETDVPRLERALRAVAGVLGDLGRDGCTERERERAATRVGSGHLFGLETVQGQAGNLGRHDALDDLAGAFARPERVAAVTVAEVRALAADILRPETATAMIYLPAGTDPAAAGLPTDDAGLGALLAAGFAAGAGGASETAGSSPPPPAPAVRSTASTDRRFRALALDCGVPLHWRRDPAVPVVAIGLHAAGGNADETAADAGAAALTRAVQLKGAGGRPAAAFHGRLEDLGVSLVPHAGRDHDGFLLSGLATRLDGALELIADLVLRPDFAPSELARERDLALAELAALQDDPFQAAALAARWALYGDHPWGRPQLGTPDSLARLDAAALRERHARTWTRGRTCIVASGDLDPERLAARLDALLADLPAGGDAAPRPPLPAPLTEVRRERLTRDQRQAVVLLTWPGPPDPVRHRVPLLLLRQLLNGQSGRLFAELRNRRSLCYNTGLVAATGRAPGMLLAYVLTAPDQATVAREALRDELVRTAVAAPKADEFARARAKLEGQLLLADQANGARVARHTGDVLHGRPRPGLEPLLEEIAACTPEEVRAAAEAYLAGEVWCETTLGPPTDG